MFSCGGGAGPKKSTASLLRAANVRNWSDHTVAETMNTMQSSLTENLLQNAQCKMLCTFKKLFRPVVVVVLQCSPSEALKKPDTAFWSSLSHVVSLFTSVPLASNKFHILSHRGFSSKAKISYWESLRIFKRKTLYVLFF